MTLMVYGDAETRRRATAWCAANGFRLREDKAGRFCRHVLVPHGRCPADGRCGVSVYEAFDHGNVWERPDGTRFLLAHVYTTRDLALVEAAPHARARGLRVCVDESMGWYGAGTVPLRYDPLVREVEVA